MAPISSLVIVASLLGAIASPLPSPVSPVEITSPVAQLNTTYSGNATFFDDHRNGCPGIQYTFEEPVAAVSAALFGDVSNNTSVCGKFVNVTRQDDPSESFIYRIVDVCPTCNDTSLDFSEVAMKQFSEHGLAPIDWQLLDELPEVLPTKPAAVKTTAVKPTATKVPKTATTTVPPKTTTTTVAPKPTKPATKPTANPPAKEENHTSQTFHGRGTWFSDTTGSCGERFSQDDMIVALNQAQMGPMWGKGSKCGQKLRVTAKGYPGKSVIVRIVDTCPHRYCSHGMLDLSRKAFQVFAPMSKGVLDLEWSFV
ncbi:expansin [Entomortierella parvispora]|uniref:Expansin n=1 Tax=Entomortierella parvispora TaxID=205924 RepID=A0A9P3LVQ4_9FUNG|nr:expansin [Entomortierella parvispora]